MNRPISKQIRDIRAARGLSQGQIAHLSGLPQSNLSRIESGKLDPRVSTMEDIARSLDMELMLIPTGLVSTVQSILGGTSPIDSPLFAATGDD